MISIVIVQLTKNIEMFPLCSIKFVFDKRLIRWRCQTLFRWWRIENRFTRCWKIREAARVLLTVKLGHVGNEWRQSITSEFDQTKDVQSSFPQSFLDQQSSSTKRKKRFFIINFFSFRFGENVSSDLFERYRCRLEACDSSTVLPLLNSLCLFLVHFIPFLCRIRRRKKMYRKYFDPLDYNLSADFRLTKLSELKGWGCKVPRDVLHRLLEGLQTAEKNGYGDGQHHPGLAIESKATPVVGKFSSIRAKLDLRLFSKELAWIPVSFRWDMEVCFLFNRRISSIHSSMILTWWWKSERKTTRRLLCFLFELQGKIACANVLSDVYAMGAVEVDNMLMLLSTSNKMSEKERDTIMPLILQGFKVRERERWRETNGIV